ncbi:MAG: hypothetical protein JOZ18_20320 [Chloroflexi bacterium]|nr:hypothetical protein [Chloroflexota bacterium]
MPVFCAARMQHEEWMVKESCRPKGEMRRRLMDAVTEPRQTSIEHADVQRTQFDSP